MLTGMLRRRVGLQVVRAFARQRLRRVGLVGIPRTEIDGWRERQQRDRTLGSRGSDALVRLSDVHTYWPMRLSTGRTRAHSTRSDAVRCLDVACTRPVLTGVTGRIQGGPWQVWLAWTVWLR